MDVLHAVFNHVVLPPKLPGCADLDIEAVSHNLLTRLIRACETVEAVSEHPWADAFHTLRGSLRACLALNRGRLDRQTILLHFRQLKPHHTLILHCVEQNAAVIIRFQSQNGEDRVIFEAFETSPPSDRVLAAENALQWDFPGRSAHLPLSEFADESFQENLATFLEQASMETLHSLQAQSHKANVSVAEVRDTTDPALITQMLMPLLEAIGGYESVPRLRKRVRDDVNLNGGDIPWRRLPLWLVLRVAAQRQLIFMLGEEAGRACYKFLMCTLMANLLRDCARSLNPDLVITLRAKLCRRMAKLEMDKAQAESTDADVYVSFFGRAAPMIKDAIQDVTAQVESAWGSFKHKTTRRVPRLPSRASGEALRLTLPNSGQYLDALLSSRPSGKAVPQPDGLPMPLEKAIQQSQDFTNLIFRLATMELRIEKDQAPTPSATRACIDRCVLLAHEISIVLHEVGTTYESDSANLGIMILTLFEIWVRMDRCAVALCPLLGQYRPIFTPQLLDVLQLSSLSNMRRLQDIQTHLRQRHATSVYDSIFSDINEHCLAVRFVKTSAEMKHLMSRIQEASDTHRALKELEWKRTTKYYDDLTEKIDNGTCVCSWTADGQRDVRGCSKCYHFRTRKKLAIQNHEDFLPKEDTRRAAVIFELAMPRYLSAYRNASWQILSGLTHPGRPSRAEPPKISLQSCLPLQPFMTATMSSISLASVKKCFTQTHYKFNRGKAPLHAVLLPFAAEFEMYDHAAKLWVRDLGQPPTLQHLLGIRLPHGPTTLLPAEENPKPDIDGPSSYEIQANQMECPSHMSVPEFSAHQKLVAGKLRRWPTILVELGSSNLNFSNEDTTRMISQLVVQAGPPLQGEVLRAIHVVFRDPEFVERFIEQVEKRLDSIKNNWRETSCMELLIVLSLRLFSLSSGATRLRAEALLYSMRGTTLAWISRVKKDFTDAQDGQTADRLAAYAFKAALLCRQTFAMCVEENNSRLRARDLCSWVQASVALQENLMVSLDKLPQVLKNMLVRDAKLAFHMESLLRVAIETYPNSVGEAIGRGSTFSDWDFLPSPNSRWIHTTTTEAQGKFTFHQTVYFEFVQGHLLINGRPRGKLPVDLRNDPDVNLLFGKQHLLTYASSMPEMSYRLATKVNDYMIHLGLRGEKVVIRAVSKEGVLEFVPQRVFTGQLFDLPASLMDNCAHWLNLKTGVLEVRRQKFWKRRKRNWFINVPKRYAERGGKVNLVDPHSKECALIAKIFHVFESPYKLTVFQPRADKGKLSVELRHLDLTFIVRGGLLNSRELKAEIDPNQDAGTWYGLDSKIVLRDTLNPHRRSVIIPLGDVSCRRRDIHVVVRFVNAVEYGRFEIDDVLNRISAAPEPRLLYTRALCHAATSFCLPDTLTGRTGTEEAFHILKSGAAQPWTSPGPAVHVILQGLAKLLPRREYYPPQLQRLQRVTWNEEMTTTIQNDGLERLIHAIQTKSNNLAQFSGPERYFTVVDEPSHLRRRGEIQRQLYDRKTLDTSGDLKIYRPRDRKATAKSANVYQITRLMHTFSEGIHVATDLGSVLESWELIGGFHDIHPQLNREPLINQIEDPISRKWGDLVNFCRHAEDKASPMFCLGLLAFASEPDMDLITSLAAFAGIKELKDMKPPVHRTFADFPSRGLPSIQTLEKQISLAYCGFEPSKRRKIRGSADSECMKHQELCEEEGKRLARHLLSQWPTLVGFRSDDEWYPTVIDVPKALETIRLDWDRRQHNDELSAYIDQVQAVLDLQSGPRITARPQRWANDVPVFIGREHGRVIPSIERDLVAKPCRKLQPFEAALSQITVPRTTEKELPKSHEQGLPQEVTKLETILTRFAASSSDVLRKNYGQDLLASLEALKDVNRMVQQSPEAPYPDLYVVMRAVDEARAMASSHLQSITAAFASHDPRFQWLDLGTIWPTDNAIETLQLLRSRSGHKFGTGMKEALVAYGLALTNLQKLGRIRHAILWKDSRMMREELGNAGHENWNPLKLPDWLLLEIDNNLLIRAEQVDVAKAIIKPASRKNTVLQMNMGKGKTSCIMPMVAAILADGNNLSRLIVPKALLVQTAQTTQLRLGGLVGRELVHVPFSRQTKTTEDILRLYAELHHKIRDARGLVLASHDHLLSYKLSGLQRLADNKLDQASSMIRFQRWLESTCRDVLDESDFTLAVKTQLNYPSGSEMPVDGHPFRWQVAEGLLALVAHHLRALQETFPRSIEVLGQPGWFPILQFLKSDVENDLQNRILDDICAGKAEFLRLESASSKSQQIIRKVLSSETFDIGLFKKAVGACTHPESAAKKLLIIRGLIINRILLLCLNKRWNVQYGLHPGRQPVAVPFEAKGVPSELAEFGHPDVAIVFTCLSFYYSGLTQKQLHQGLQRVLTSEDPAIHFERLTSECANLPHALRHWNMINVDDDAQMGELWKCLHKDRIAVDHYLNNFVFPAHARQFSVKLQASAWDVPLLSHGRAKTTGFSGTNDNRIMLPFSIKQDDLPSLRQTNAEVLSYLLQRRNSGYQVAANQTGKRLSEEELLRVLLEQNIRILIDSGAYVLEMDNRSLAKLWLVVDHEAKAAVFFGKDNRAWVLFRDEGKSDVPLVATPFANDLSECVVYLDEAHTRGVDLKLPEHACGALTLALKQTKDYTMQAAMRLRQLRTTQRVIFFAPPEVDQSIRDLGEVCGSVTEELDSSHVVFWLLEQTCRANEDLFGLYVAQGLDFCKRQDAQHRYPDFLSSSLSRSKLLKVLQQPEHLSLEQLYGDQSVALSARPLGRMLDPQLQGFADKLAESNNNLSLVHSGALDEVEQEREVELQVEAVREVQKPGRYHGLAYPGLHRDVVSFAQTGALVPLVEKDVGFEHAFEYMAGTEVGGKFGVRNTGSRLYVSRQFCRTVKLSKSNRKAGDNFLRPVEWILWSPSTETALVIIPEEAEELIPKLRHAAKSESQPMTHLIAYAAPVTRAMVPFNQLRYYVLPPLPAEPRFPEWMKVELGILAGRLYVDFAEWSSVTDYIASARGVVDGLKGESSDKSSNDGAQLSAFLLEWLSIRRKTQDVLHTPMGYICMDRTVAENHPFFLTPQDDSVEEVREESEEDDGEETDVDE